MFYKKAISLSHSVYTFIIASGEYGGNKEHQQCHRNDDLEEKSRCSTEPNALMYGVSQGDLYPCCYYRWLPGCHRNCDKIRNCRYQYWETTTRQGKNSSEGLKPSRLSPMEEAIRWAFPSTAAQRGTWSQCSSRSEWTHWESSSFSVLSLLNTV